ncbi:MAG TPA: 5-formyltetrahydrofolate cyclo-ligase [Polyangiaceae bacterium]|nr:5-formyltetrahydrofolate cyclo-ligase [Polyangiaceae bacterium]
MSPLDPKLFTEVAARAKQQLRTRMKALRSAHPEAALAERSARVVERVANLPDFAAARGVALFWPMLDQKEVDVRALDALARSDGKRVYYPGFAEAPGGALGSEFRLTSSPDELAVRAHRFLEPPPDAAVARRGDVELVVVPALAAALSGHRLGFGIGFYDSLLPDHCPPARAVVVLFDFQLLAELPVMPHDVACDFVVTDAKTSAQPVPPVPLVEPPAR